MVPLCYATPFVSTLFIRLAPETSKICNATITVGKNQNEDEQKKYFSRKILAQKNGWIEIGIDFYGEVIEWRSP